MPQAALAESLIRVRLRTARGGKCRIYHHLILIYMLAQDGVFVNLLTFSIMMRQTPSHFLENDMNINEIGPWRRLTATLGWTRSSYFLMCAFLATLLVIMIVWWPLVEAYLSLFDPGRSLWRQIDWLLIGNFVAMSLLIMAGADLKTDAFIVLVGLVGGLSIEGWGTQTELWIYFTVERPPLWIIPAWPIASLSIDRLVRLLHRRTTGLHPEIFVFLYWMVFSAFYGLMLSFVLPTLDKSLTIMALSACGLMILSPTDHRLAVLTFVAGAGLGYFLERWGTTRHCWIYYTRQAPPLFAVLAHGMASVAFWRVGLLVKKLRTRLFAVVADQVRG